MRALAPVAVANLRLCARQNSARLHELILVFDCPFEDIPARVGDVVREISSSIKVRLLGYGDRQHWLARRINWGWVYSWMSWSIALGQARTRTVILHDLDAMPVDPQLFEQLYDHWVEEGAEFCGIQRYVGHGVTEDMGLVTTYELALDAAHVRLRFRPFELFNKLDFVDGRVVDFDTVLHAQWQSPRRAVRSIDETQLVHPTQMICNYSDLVSGRSDFRDRSHTLMALPYFMYLGGDASQLTTAGPQLTKVEARSVALFGRDLRIDGVTPQQWAWMEKQIRRLEQAIFGETRREVAEYLGGFIRRAGRHRTVGVETGATAVADR
jgi:hypothetical protein